MVSPPSVAGERALERLSGALTRTHCVYHGCHARVTRIAIINVILTRLAFARIIMSPQECLGRDDEVVRSTPPSLTTGPKGLDQWLST